ncbi:MAG: hypothetical protein SVU32_08125, partial [Candidatus Nanohaloarchaea archaeon]|nr:hypothetical protein [Candidatus Nanohaloarchaea archaeon]
MNTGYRVALFLCIVGTILVFAGEQLHSVPEIPAQRISESHIGEKIVTGGTVNDLHVSDGVTFIRFEEVPDLTIVTFTERYDITAGDHVKVTGRVKLYQGELEVVAEDISRVTGRNG